MDDGSSSSCMQIGKIDETDDDGDLFPGESNTEDVLEGGVRYWPDVCDAWFKLASEDFVPRVDSEPCFTVPRECPGFSPSFPRKSDHFLGLELPWSLRFQPGVSHCELMCCIVGL
jgi:hypothetical protein